MKVKCMDSMMKMIVLLVMGTFVLSIGMVALLGAGIAYADEVAVGARTDVTATEPTGIQSRESWPNKPYWFNFKDNETGVSQTTGWKDDNTSFWVNVTQWDDVWRCNFYADAYVGGWIDCTTPGYGACYGPGQYELYNKVSERYGKRECRLGGYRSGGSGFVSGEWTPDCEGHFTVMR